MKVEIDIPDELFTESAKVAHSLDMTFNEFASLALESYMHKIEVDETVLLEKQVVEAAANVVGKGVTIDTLKAFGNAYERWFNESAGEKTIRDLIQEGFDMEDDNGTVKL